MTWVEEPLSGVTALSAEPLSIHKVTENLEYTQTSLCVLKNRRAVSKIVWGAMLFMMVMGFFVGLPKAWAADTPQTPTIKVQPTVTQPGGTVTLTFGKETTASSVKIGANDAAILWTGSASIAVRVPPNTQSGAHDIIVTLADPAASPLRSSITVAPSIPASIINVEPRVTQPDGTVFLTFSKEVEPSSVTIGVTNATIISKEPSRIEVKAAPNTQLGTQDITVILADGAASPLKNAITVAPEVTGLRANKSAELQLSRVAVSGGEIIIQFNASIPSELKQKLAVKFQEDWELDPNDPNSKKPEDKEGKFTIPQNDYLILHVREDLDPAKSYTVQVLADGTPLERKPKLRVIYISSVYKWASIALGALIILIYLVYRFFYKIPAGQTRYSFVKMLLLEQENQTYSLSRAQFVAWLTVISWCFLFLYYARGYVEGFVYPSLGNAVYAFFISLGTLVVAQATSIGQGVKGAGEVHPSLADLVVHGGVLALDRVQQVIWTLIALGMFLRITVSSYATATALPDIPGELLGLMGLSSIGYLGGKLVRGPGPVIEQVTARAGSVILNIKGRQLSKDGFVWLDGVQQPKEKISFKADDPNSPLKFAKELEVTLDISLADWNAKDHAITFINGDAQRADWRTGPKIIDVTPGQAGADGKVPLVIKGAHLASGATLEITGAPDVKPVQDEKDPNLFTAKVDPAWLTAPHELIVTSSGQKSTYSFKPA